MIDTPGWWNPRPFDAGGYGVDRLRLGVRLDGVGVDLMADREGFPRFIAVFPTDPTGRAVLLDAGSSRDAFTEIDQRWPPSPWCRTPEELPADAIDLGGGDVLVPMLVGGTGERVMRLSVNSQHYTGQRYSAPFETERVQRRARLVGLAVEITGVGVELLISSFHPAGHMNALHDPEAVIVGAGAQRHYQELRRLRAYDFVEPTNCVQANVALSTGPDGATAQLWAILRRVTDRELLQRDP